VIRVNRFLIITFTCCLAFVFGAVANAQDNAEGYRIGVVNAVRILEQSPQARKTTALIENEFSPRNQQLVADQQQLQTMEERLNKDAAIMGESERRNLERDIINKRRELKRSEDEFREDLTFRRNEELAKIQTEIVNAIQIVAQQNNFDLVISDGVIYASQQMDMTDMVIQYLSEQASTASE
jgi:outer membrane protein